MAGTVIVLWLVGVTVVEASINDLPAVRDGEFAAVGLSSIGKLQIGCWKSFNPVYF